MKKIAIIAPILLGFLFVTPVFAADYYVDGDNGNDLTGSGTQATPYATLTKALTVISGGDTIYCKGTVNGSVTIPSTVNGSADAYTTITSWPGYTGTIYGDSEAVAYAITFDADVEYINISNLNITNGKNFGLAGTADHLQIIDNTIYGIVNDTTSIYVFLIGNNCLVSGNSIYGTDYDGDYGLYLVGSDNIIERNAIHDFNRFGIGIEGSDNVDIKNNFIYNIGSNDDYDLMSGIVVASSTDMLIYNNSMYNIDDATVTNKPAAIRFLEIVAGDSDSEIKNNIFSASYYGIALDNDSAADTNINNNDFYNLDYIGLVDADEYASIVTWRAAFFTPDADSITEDPGFISTTFGSEDLHINSTSPCLDAGETITTITDDFDNEARPYGLGIDIGADELPILSDAPTNISAEGLVKKANLVWDFNDNYNVTGFNVKVGTLADVSDGTEQVLNDSKSAQVTGLQYAKKYYAMIQAVYTTEYSTYISDYSDIISFVTLPKKVKNIKAPKKYRTNNKVKIIWDRVRRVKNYEIKVYKKKSTNGYKYIKKIRVKNKKNKQKQVKYITKLKPDTQYKVKIRARKVLDSVIYNGSWSDYKKHRTGV